MIVKGFFFKFAATTEYLPHLNTVLSRI